MKPIITIIVPVYNAEKFIDKCIKSILKQTFKNFELILINDGSKDDSYKICEHYTNIDNRIYLINKDNSGVSSARNIGINMANGEYLMFVDSDDWINEDMLENMYNEITKQENDLIICGEKAQELNGRFIIRTFNEDRTIKLKDIKESEFYELISTYSIYGPCRKLYKLNLVNKNNIRFNENLTVYEDLMFNIEYLKYVKYIRVIKSIYYNYMLNDNSLTRKEFTKALYCNFIFIYSELIKFLNGINIFENKIKDFVISQLGDTYLKYINSIYGSKIYNKNEKKDMFYLINNWKDLNMYLEHYIKIKKIKNPYKTIIKLKNKYVWFSYLKLNKLR